MSHTGLTLVNINRNTLSERLALRDGRVLIRTAETYDKLFFSLGLVESMVCLGQQVGHGVGGVCIGRDSD